MRTSLLTFLLFLATQFAYGQNLLLDTFDHETKQVIRETEWIKVNGEHRTRLKIKFKRIGDEVKLYCTLNRPNNQGPTSEKNHVEIMLSNKVKMVIPLRVRPDSIIMVEMEDVISHRIEGTIRTYKPTDEPDAITSVALSNEQLALLAANGIEQMDLYYEKTKDIMQIKEKYRYALKVQVGMMR